MRLVRAVDGTANVTHVFFDFAGTLVEGVPCWEHPQIVACAECGQAVTPAEVKAAIGRVWGPLEGCAHPAASVDEATYATWIGDVERRILARLGLSEPNLDRAARRVTELQVAAASYRVYPDVVPTLDGLRRCGIKLGIISNFAWRLPDLVADLGLAPFVDLVVTSARVGYRKPRPEIFVRALAALDARPQTTLYVGDDPRCDGEGARGVGIRALLLDRTCCPPPDAGAIARLTELLDHLGSSDNLVARLRLG